MSFYTNDSYRDKIGNLSDTSFEAKNINNTEDSKEFESYINPKETKGKLKISSNTIKTTLKNSIDEFEKKIGQLENELNLTFQPKIELKIKNEPSKCKILDEKIDLLHKKMKSSIHVAQNKQFDSVNLDETLKKIQDKSNKKEEAENTLIIKRPEYKNDHLFLKNEIKNLNLSLINTLETLNKNKKELNEKFSEKNAKENIENDAIETKPNKTSNNDEDQKYAKENSSQKNDQKYEKKHSTVKNNAKIKTSEIPQNRNKDEGLCVNFREEFRILKQIDSLKNQINNKINEKIVLTKKQISQSREQNKNTKKTSPKSKKKFCPQCVYLLNKGVSTNICAHNK